MDSIERWNARYRSGEWGPDSPSPLLVEAAAGLEPGRALDLACGAGRNALWLAEHGWEVTAIDGSVAAIEQIRGRLSSGPEPAKSRLYVDARVLDLEREALPFGDAAFDLVCIIHFLHRPLFAEAKRVVRAGGIVVAAIHTTRSSMNPRYCVAPGELRSYFEGWKLLIDREGEIAEVVAQR